MVCHMLRLALPAVLSAFLFLASGNAASACCQRIVSLSGSLTEAIATIGMGDKLVGVDRSSLRPRDVVGHLPRVGSPRAVSMESLLAVNPDTVVAYDDLEPKNAIEHLKSLNIHVITVPRLRTIESARDKFTTIATGLGAKSAGEKLVANIDADLAWPANKQPPKQRKHGLFIQTMGNGPFMVAGQDTSAEALMTAARIDNAVQGVSKYKPLNIEAAATAEPDIIIILSRALQRMGGLDGLKELPSLKYSPAVLNNKILVVDSAAFLGLGPTLGKEVRRLRELAYGK